MASLHPTPRKLTIGRAQAVKLLKGGSIALKHTHIDHPEGEHTWLTATQHRRLEGAKGKGSGARLRFSQAQIRHHIKGGGFWGNVWNGIKGVAKKVGNTVADGAKVVWKYGKPVIKPVLQLGVKAGTEALKKVAGARAGPVGEQAVGVAGDWVGKQVDGLGVRGGRRGKKKTVGLGAGGAGLVLPGHHGGMGLYPPGVGGGSILPAPVKGKAYSMLS